MSQRCAHSLILFAFFCIEPNSAARETTDLHLFLRDQFAMNALRAAIVSPTVTGNVLLECLRDVCTRSPDLWRRFLNVSTASVPSFENVVNADAATSGEQASEHELDVQFLAGGLSNLQWVVNREFVLRVSTAPASQDVSTGPSNPAFEGPKGNLQVERAVLHALSSLSCAVYGQGSFSVAAPLAVGQSPGTPTSDDLVAKYTVLEFIHGKQLEESVFQEKLPAFSAILADHHVRTSYRVSKPTTWHR